MQFEELLRREKEEGQERMLKLIRSMTSDGRQSELPRLSEDSKFCEEMFKKYQL